ncbi:MAG: Thiamine-phosphate synthase [candidate division BRC1 bacterium ADurb.BinA364]|nr:MAG: Thiamine-phosphate synthase [candidate division BRC1 bacterium ADurb.BinA364]
MADSMPNKPRVGEWGLYAIVDPEHCIRHNPLRAARLLLEGGARALQLRDKMSPFDDRLALALRLKALCDEYGAHFIVNDDPGLALAAGADGVHVGQDDTPVSEARGLLGPDAIIGLSTHTRGQALEGQHSGADYLGFGPMFMTQTKDQPYAPLGVDEARWAARTLTLPFVAIGGIARDNVGLLAEAGTRNAAAIGALLRAGDIKAEARFFAEALRYGKNG